MKLSVIIPCFNEKTIFQLLEAVRSTPIKDKQIIVVDDCSNDGTREILETLEDKAGIDIIYHGKNRERELHLVLVLLPQREIFALFKMQT